MLGERNRRNTEYPPTLISKRRLVCAAGGLSGHGTGAAHHVLPPAVLLCAGEEAAVRLLYLAQQLLRQGESLPHRAAGGAGRQLPGCLRQGR